MGLPLEERCTMFTCPAFTVDPFATKVFVISELGPKKLSVVALVEFGAELELEEEAVGEEPLPGEVVEVELLLLG